MNLETFIKSGIHNQWIKEGRGLSVYVRQGRRYIKGTYYNTLDLATITSNKPGSGQLTPFIEKSEALALKYHFEMIFIENVLNERLLGWFERRRYTKIETGGHVSFYFVVKKQ